MPKRPAVAVIGCGQWGRNHVRTLATLGALGAICDQDPQNLDPLVQAHGVAAKSYDAIIADTAIAAVVLALPAEQNAPMALKALAAGKHVFVEKPIALTSRDAHAMVTAAEAGGRVLMVGHILRYHNAFTALSGQVAAGAIGRVRHIQSHRLGFGKFYGRFDALWDLAPHDLSLILSLVDGVPETAHIDPVSVTDGQIDLGHIHLAFAGGPTAHAYVSRHSAYNERRFAVVGETGTLLWDDLADWAHKLVLLPHRVRRGEGDIWRHDAGAPRPIDVTPGLALTDELEHFLDCVETGRTPLTPGQQGYEVVRILEMATS